jgi:hypothetical protein
LSVPPPTGNGVVNGWGERGNKVNLGAENMLYSESLERFDNLVALAGSALEILFLQRALTGDRIRPF